MLSRPHVAFFFPCLACARFQVSVFKQLVITLRWLWMKAG